MPCLLPELLNTTLEAVLEPPKLVLRVICVALSTDETVALPRVTLPPPETILTESPTLTPSIFPYSSLPDANPGLSAPDILVIVSAAAAILPVN